MHRFTESSGRAVLALHEDARGRLWMGAAGAGLACWTGQRSLSWTTQNGLPDDVIYGVIEDADGDLWLSVGRGIFRASRELLQEALATGEPWRNKIMFEIKGPAEQIMASGWPRALQVIQGKLWFATAAGLIAADKRRPEQAVTASPPVYLENVVVNGKAVSGLGSASDLGSGVSGLGSNALPETRDPRPETQTLRLPVDLESLEFHFTAPSFVAPEKLQFRHWLEGADRDWVVDGTERRVRYGRLPSGDYRFRVAASLVDGVWNEAAESFAFTVPTPLWRTPAALAFYVLIAVGTVAGVVRVVSTRRLRQHLERLEGQRVVERERMRIAQDMHDDIGSKLTKISFLSERAKQSFKFQVPGSKLNNSALQEASGVGNLEPGTRNLEQETFGQIESIATTSRELLQTLDEIVWAVNPRNDSLEHLAAYLSHYAAEYFQNTSVQCDLRMPRDLPHQPLSAELRHNLFLAFEEVLNNVLKHSGATSVNVEMTLMRTKFQIVIADNGCGFNVAATRAERPANSTRRGGNGLVNLQQRLSVVGGDCVVTSQPGHGTTVTLRIPLASTAKVKL